MKSSKTLILVGMGLSLTFFTGGGRVGCGAGIETNPASGVALQIQPVVEEITLDGENFYAVCTNHSCEDVEWSLTDPDTGESVAALDLTPKNKARFNRRPGERNGGKVIPDPAIPDRTRLNVRACTTDGEACDEIQVTVLKSENDALKDLRLINESCEYDSVGAMDTKTSSVNVSSVFVTPSNRECFDNPIGSLQISISGKNFTPSSDDYVFSPFKIELLGIELPRGGHGECPDLQTGTPQFIGLDGTRYDFFVDDGNGGHNFNHEVVKELEDIMMEVMDISLRWVNQLCGDFTAEDFESDEDTGGFMGAMRRSLSRLSLREVIDCAQGVVITAENMVEWIPSLFSSGMVFDQSGDLWNLETLYSCMFEGDAFGDRGPEFLGVSSLNMKFASILSGGQQSGLSQDGGRPTIIPSTDATVYITFDRQLNTQTVGDWSVHVCSFDQGCVTPTNFSFNPGETEVSFGLTGMLDDTSYEVMLEAGTEGVRGSNGAKLSTGKDGQYFVGTFLVETPP